MSLRGSKCEESGDSFREEESIDTPILGTPMSTKAIEAPSEIPLSEAARRMRVSWAVAWRKALTGEVEAVQRGRHWYVLEASLPDVDDA